MPTSADMKIDQQTTSLPNCTAVGQPIRARSRTGPIRGGHALRVA
ncbi:MAG: hypothetical protein ACYTF4_02835 [Planctomycetota bacterium]